MAETRLNLIKQLSEKIDRKALAGAVGVMLLSWAGLPIVYWLLTRKNAKKSFGSHQMEAVRDQSKETEKS